MEGVPIDNIMQILQQMNKTNSVMATHEISIKGVRSLLSCTQSDFMTEALDRAIDIVTRATKVDARRRYDCVWLGKQVVRKIRKAQRDGATVIMLENRCCVNSSCPEMTLMKAYVEELKES